MPRGKTVLLAYSRNLHLQRNRNGESKMKGGGDVVIDGRSMAGVSRTLSNCPAQAPCQTHRHSHFCCSYSMELQAIHTHLQSLSPVTRSTFSFSSALALAAAPATPKKVKRRAHSSFHDYPEFLSVLLNCQHICFPDLAYQLFKGICDIAHRGILITEKTSDYMSFIFYQVLLNCQHICFPDSAYQLFKGICDIAHRGILITEKTSDYMSFIFYQMAGYLLLSSSFVTVLAIQQLDSSMLLRKAAVVSVCMPFATFLVAACALYLATSSAKGLQGDASQVAQRLQLLGSVNS